MEYYIDAVFYNVEKRDGVVGRRGAHYDGDPMSDGMYSCYTCSMVFGAGLTKL